MTLNAEQVHARLTTVSVESGIPCPELATIRPDEMQVCLVMSLCRHAGADYAAVFSARSAAR